MSFTTVISLSGKLFCCDIDILNSVILKFSGATVTTKDTLQDCKAI